jgi:two-component SAPR family response regulator
MGCSSTMCIKTQSIHKAPAVEDKKDKLCLIKLFFERSYKDLKANTYDDPLLELQNFRNGIYDFILLEIKMKPIDGLELYKKIREIDREVKVFIFTVSDPKFEEYEKPCSSFEEKYFIQKPISLHNLSQCVSTGIT